jgi:translocation and assembly module TamB
VRGTLRRLLGVLGWVLLGALALVGVGISTVVGFSASSLGRPVVASLVARQVDALLAGRIELEGVLVLPRGGVEIRGLRVFDPDGHLVLLISSVRVFPELTRLSSRELGLVVELDGPSILLESEANGGVSLARAFAPAEPAPAASPSGEPLLHPSWTLRLTRLTVRGGELWWQRADGSTGAEVTGLEVDTEGSYGPAGGFLGLQVRAAVTAPVAGPLALAAAARLQGGRLEVPVLRASLGPSVLEALGEGNLDTLAFRGAVTRLGLKTAELRRLVPSATPSGDLTATAYAESDGTLATAELQVAPAGGGQGDGRAVAALAARLAPPSTTLGFDVDVSALDPSRLLAQAPPGRLTFTARGAGSGRSLATARGHLALEVAPSRLRRGELGPIVASARADRGLIEVSKLTAQLPGLALTGSGLWRERGAVAGQLTIEATDLARLGEDLEALTGDPLPPMGGTLHGQATLAGTGDAPIVHLTAQSPALRSGTARAEGVTLTLDASGPAAAARGQLTGSAARVVVGTAEARRVALAGSLTDEEASLSLSGVAPQLGAEPLTLKALARLAPGRQGAELRELSLGWPADRLALVRPATITFSPAGLDRLELASGPRRLILSGGLGPKEVLDVRLVGERLDLARLPSGLVISGSSLVGELSFEAHATGTLAHPVLAAKLSLEGGGAHGLAGLQLRGELGWDDAASRLRADLALRRAEGGRLDLQLDLPLPLSTARPSEPLVLHLVAADWSIETLRRLADIEAPMAGLLGAHLELTGTVATPGLQAGLTLQEAVVDGQGPLAATATLQGIDGLAKLHATAQLAGAPALEVDARLPLDLVALLLRPEATLRGLPGAPLSGTLEVPGLELAAVAGRSGLPAGMTGRLTGGATLGGTLLAPRGQARLALADGLVAGYRDLAGQLEVAAEAARTTLTLRASIAGAEALRLEAALGAPLERLGEPATLRATPVSLEATVPDLPLARTSSKDLPVTGVLSGKLKVSGTLARPEGRLDLGGKGVVVQGKPLGDLGAVLRYQAPTGTAELSIHPSAGGVLWAGATLEAPLGLDATAAGLRDAPATLRVTSDQLDLGFLPAMAPGLVRAAAGRLDVDLTAAGALWGLRPRGTIKLTGGRLAVTELGDWTEVELEAALGDRSIEVPRLGVRRGAGRIAGHLSARELGTPQARIEGRLEFQKYALARAGMELASLDFPLELSGTASDELLDLTVTLPGGTIRLPRTSPRTLQSLEPRADIQVGRPHPRQASWLEVLTAPAPGDAPRKPYEARVHLLAPGKLFLKSDRPTIDLELKADSTFKLVATDLKVDGAVEVVRGTVEPFSGRLFRLDRGRITFGGGALEEGQLDVVARYDNPAAEVTVTIGGSMKRPSVLLASRPAMDDAAIAMLIATGRTEINLNTTDVGTMAAQDAGMAVASAAVGMAFKSLLSDKLPVDQVTVDASTLRAGKYFTDKLFVGYTYRFEAKPENGQNTNEVRAEYKVTPRWNFELRYGDAQAGDASLIWSKDY